MPWLCVKTYKCWAQWTLDVIIASLLRQSDIATSFWRNNDVTITLCVLCSLQDLFVTVLTYFLPPPCPKSLWFPSQFPWLDHPLRRGVSLNHCSISLFLFRCPGSFFSRFYWYIFVLVFSGTSDRGRSERRSSLDAWLAPDTDDAVSGRYMLMNDTHTDGILHCVPYV